MPTWIYEHKFFYYYGIGSTYTLVILIYYVYTPIICVPISNDERHAIDIFGGSMLVIK